MVSARGCRNWLLTPRANSSALQPDHLTLLQKVEVFNDTMSKTNGEDLKRVMWLKSKNAETWLDRRTNFTRSLATMSMVGYILGLGDRHPQNLLLDSVSGKVLHVDFGDCFEVAIHREKFPETIPFRLTRMLRKAMEVSGIEGNFRMTCESVLRVLRQNRTNVMAMVRNASLCNGPQLSFDSRAADAGSWRRLSTTLWSTGG